MKCLAAVIVLAAIHGRASAQLCGSSLLTNGPVYGGGGNFFADMNGDGNPDFVTVGQEVRDGGTEPYSISVRYRDPWGVFFQSEVHIYGMLNPSIWDDWGLTAVVDVNGDGFPDALQWGARVHVRLNNRAGSLGPRTAWSTDQFYGEKNFVADVDGDNRADLIAVNREAVYVRRSTGSYFGPTEVWLSWRRPLTALGEWHFADLDGDRRADAIGVDPTYGIYVRHSLGYAFESFAQQLTDAMYAPHGTHFADVTGDGLPDAIGIQENRIVVRANTGSYFLGETVWLTTPPFTGTAKTAFVNVDSSPGADLVMVNWQNPVLYRPSHRRYFYVVPPCV
jgi:hypothetical protein